jgi:hypothetical protein
MDTVGVSTVVSLKLPEARVTSATNGTTST